jgi:UDP-galactopyranose mutase
MKITVAGAGFTGATIARCLASRNHEVTVVERRDHVAGNAYDHDVHGVRVHKYGPHIFHTKSDRVFEFLSQFTEWTPYEHRVMAKLHDGTHVPFPPNRKTLMSVSRRDLVDTFYRPYTELMWARPLENVAPAILNRVPIREDDEDRYFPNDKYQAMPTNGYNELVCRMLDHPNIRLLLNHDIDREEKDTVDHLFYSGSMDEYFSYSAGDLPYRSIIFDTKVIKQKLFQPATTVNYVEGKDRTRTTEWKWFPNSFKPDSYTVITTEYPCSYLENKMERFYPIRDEASLKILNTYQEMAKGDLNVSFVGRCGSFAYLDMDQAVNQGLQVAEKFLENNK